MKLLPLVPQSMQIEQNPALSAHNELCQVNLGFLTAAAAGGMEAGGQKARLQAQSPCAPAAPRCCRAKLASRDPGFSHVFRQILQVVCTSQH